MDQESLTERASKLENEFEFSNFLCNSGCAFCGSFELFEYQYNMGLLLIEKKEWAVKYEELRQALAETTDTLKREQTAHSSALSEVEKREENLKKALGVERQCVLDLEKALREVRSEYAEIKFNADSKLAEANALVTSVEEKSLEVEAKFHAADAKLAEVSRKSSEIERKLHELEAQENALRRERSFFTTEREAHDTALSKQREDLREWERKLQEAEERLADSRRLLNQREERANENDRILKEKQNDLEELRKKIEISNSTLKNKEDDISSRLASIALKEKASSYLTSIHSIILVLEAGDVKKRLEEKEKQLLELEEKLNTREKVRTSSFDSLGFKDMLITKSSFFLSFKVEIQKLVDEHKSILTEKQKEFELEMEQRRKEHDDQLKNKLVEVEKKEAEIAHVEEKLKKREQAIEKKSEKVREKELDFDSKLKDFRGREKSLRVEEQNLEKERKQMVAEKEDLLRVKDELENLKADSETLQLRLNEERQQLKVTEEERIELARLQSELKQEIDKYRFQSEELMKEADDLKEAKEKFEKEWEELDDKRAEIKKEQEEVLEQQRSLEKLRHSEEERLRNEKLEIQQYVQRNWKLLNWQKILLLLAWSMKSQCWPKNPKKLKDQREQFIKERERFIAFAEKQKNCEACGETIREFVLSDLHSLTELENLEAPPLPRVAENYLKEAVEGTVERFGAESSPGLVNSGSPTAGGTISWLRKCTSKIFKFSPGKKLELDYAQDPMGISALSEKQVVGSAKTLPSDVSALSEKQVVGLPETSPSGEKEPEASLQIANDSFEFQIVESDSALREVDAGQALSVDQDPLSVPEDSQNSKLKAQRRPGKGGRPRASRTRSVKAAVDGSKTNGNVENSVYTNDDSQAESDLVGTPKKIRKRNHTATVSDNQTEGHSESIKDGDRPRRRQRVVATEPSPGQKRYNLRQPKKSVGTVANGSLPRVGRGKEKETNQLAGAEANQSENVEIGGASREEVNEPGAAAARPRGFRDRDGDEPVRSNWAASEFSADSPFKIAGDTHVWRVDTANTSVDDVVGSEVNGMAEGTRGYSHEEFKSESHGGEDDNNDGDDDEVDHPSEVSIGKKLWTFLTT
ncbi:UNVERIFIED_CONTAM: protein CROWDED NUCLEI 1 [Sesamum angustifolium]|uniref:Protein CROWDED NUCLEI 1 n=1 Tax=Sesamum angustifolium TaxID=2727405 RepID=A0AAW2NK26_9LAMI